MSDSVRVSVRSLVEFILRSGDIDERRGGMADRDAMQLGSRLHRKLQKSMGKGYRAETALSMTVPFDGVDVTVEGRADGIYEEDGLTIVDEIKGIMRSIENLAEPVPVHLAQARCYAAIYAEQQELDRIGVRMTYASLETEQVRYFYETWEREALTAWFLNVVGRYQKWAQWQTDWRALMRESVHGVSFPYPYRPGQHDLAAGVYRTIARGKKLFIQAPTGAGKTLSVVFPSVKAMGEGLAEKIFYLTARTVTRTVAQEAFRLLTAQGLRSKIVTITAKEKICLCPGESCSPESCPYAKGHFDRINDAVFDLLAAEDVFDRETLQDWAKERMVCPFELSLDVSTWADAVICDYNYVFDPRAYLRRFFADGAKGSYVFLVDEAHNLVERGREMFSASLVKEDFLALKRQGRGRDAALSRALERCSRAMLAMKRASEDKVTVLPDPGTFPAVLTGLCGCMEDFLEDCRDEALREDALSLYFAVRTFLDVCDRLDECYVTYSELLGSGEFRLNLLCVDPSANLQEIFDRGIAAVLFSATLLPLDYYRKLLSRSEEDYAVYARSSFDPARRSVLIGRDTSTRYTLRGPQQYRRIAEWIRLTAEAREGNYMVFFPSYRMLEDVADCFADICPPGIRTIMQKSGMTEPEREAFLDAFEAEPEGTLVGFCVMGSVFGEGIDLRRDRLIGAVIVGCGIPQVCTEREILKDYFDKRGMDGFRFSYLCPGMNKVLQAAGRVIRTEEDAGVIVLLDERFTREQYRGMFPREWAGVRAAAAKEAGPLLSAFWAGLEEKKNCSKLPDYDMLKRKAERGKDTSSGEPTGAGE